MKPLQGQGTGGTSGVCGGPVASIPLSWRAFSPPAVRTCSHTTAPAPEGSLGLWSVLSLRSPDSGLLGAGPGGGLVGKVAGRK